MYRFKHYNEELFRFDDQLALCVAIVEKHYIVIVFIINMDILKGVSFNGVWNLFPTVRHVERLLQPTARRQQLHTLIT